MVSARIPQGIRASSRWKCRLCGACKVLPTVPLLRRPRCAAAVLCTRLVPRASDARHALPTGRAAAVLSAHPPTPLSEVLQGQGWASQPIRVCSALCALTPTGAPRGLRSASDVPSDPAMGRPRSTSDESGPHRAIRAWDCCIPRPVLYLGLHHFRGVSPTPPQCVRWMGDGWDRVSSGTNGSLRP